MRIQRLKHQQYSVPLTRCQHFCRLITFLEIIFFNKIPFYRSSLSLISSHSESWELGHMVQAWATIHKDEGDQESSGVSEG